MLFLFFLTGYPFLLMQTLCFINCQLQLILKQLFDQEIYFFGKKTQSTKIPITDIIRIL